MANLLKSFKLNSGFALILITFCTSCVESVVVGSTAVGVVAIREKNVSDTKKDIIIATKLNLEFMKNGLKSPGNMIDFDVDEGRVLLTGIARDVKKANLASDLAWKIPEVKEVVDEIQLSNDELHAKDFSKAMVDYLITAELRARLLAAKDVNSINYQVTTVGKTVYFIGIAANKKELEKVLSIAAKIKGVKKVVNHIILVDDKRRN